MRRALSTAATLLWLLLFVAPVLAQGSVTIDIERGITADRGAIERAANDLARRGANVAIYLVQSGDDEAFTRRLQDDGLGQGDSVDANLVAIFVSFNPRFSSIAYGDGWNAALATNNNAEAIRLNQLNAGLAAGDTTRGVVDALNAVGRSIDNPPTSGGGTNIDINLVPLAIGAVVVASLVIGTPLLLAAGKRRRAFGAARQQATEARQQAGAAISDLAQLSRTAREKAQFDALSYPGGEVSRLTTLMDRAAELARKAHEAFDEANEELVRKRNPTQADYQRVTASYRAVKELVDAARAPLEEAERIRAELDALARQAPEEIERPKKS